MALGRPAEVTLARQVMYKKIIRTRKLTMIITNLIIRDGRPAPRGTLHAGRGGFPAPTCPVKMIKTAGKLWGKIKA